MKNDDQLPFAKKIKSYVECDSTEAESVRRFEMTAGATKQVFDTGALRSQRRSHRSLDLVVLPVHQGHVHLLRFEEVRRRGKNDLRLDRSLPVARVPKSDQDHVVERNRFHTDLSVRVSDEVLHDLRSFLQIAERWFCQCRLQTHDIPRLVRASLCHRPGRGSTDPPKYRVAF